MKHKVALLNLLICFSSLLLAAPSHASPNAVSLELTNADRKRDSELKPYMIELRVKIQKCWNPNSLRKPLQTTVHFEIMGNGELSDVKVVAPSGQPQFDESASASIQNAGPFATPPQPGGLQIDAAFDSRFVDPHNIGSTSAFSQGKQVPLPQYQPLQGQLSLQSATRPGFGKPHAPSLVGGAQSAEQAPLQAGIEHSQQLPPVGPGFCIGAQYDESKLPPIDTEEGWYWIPTWAAGVFHRDFHTRTTKEALPELAHFLLTGARHSQTSQDRLDWEPAGWQTDSNGGIWHYFHIPYIEHHEGSTTFESKAIMSYKVIHIDQSEVAAVYWCRTLVVNKFSRLVEGIYQQEEIDVDKPSGPGTIREFASIKWFDALGRPAALTGSTVDSYISDNLLVRQYAPINYYKGKDMRISFRTYLMSHGLADLVPLELR